jgi:hypothetical protein
MKLKLGFIIVLTTCYSFAQDHTFDFLKTNISSRAAALGGSFVSNHEDADVIFYNPAGTSFLKDIPVSFNFIKHLLDINLASFSASKDFEGIGRISAGIKYINYGSFTGADNFGNKTGEYGAGEIAFIAGYSGLISENFYYGANLKFIYSGIENYSSTALATDIGIHYVIPDQNLHFGLAVLNLGTQLSSYISTKENLPLDVTIGLSDKLKHLPLQFFIDFHSLNKKQSTFLKRFNAFTIGGEFTLSKVFKLRFGYDNQRRQDFKIANFAGLAGFNFGLGINVKEYNFNYSFSSLGEVGALHSIGITTAFN